MRGRPSGTLVDIKWFFDCHVASRMCAWVHELDAFGTFTINGKHDREHAGAHDATVKLTPLLF